MELFSKRATVVATWALVLLGVSAQDDAAINSGYEWVDPLIGTINGGELDSKWEIHVN
jgi:hypothetical protein